MRQCDEIFLKAMKSSITSQPFDVDISDFKDWQNLYLCAQNHQVLPMIYDTLYEYEIPDRIKSLWKKQTLQITTTQIRKTLEFTQIYNVLRNANIIPLVFKGIICRNTYPNPDLRISGDEDILINKDDLYKVDKILTELNFTRDKEIIENTDEVGYRNLNTGLYLEIHIKLFSEDSVYSFLNDEFIDVFKNYVEVDIDSSLFLTFDYTDHLFYLFCHSYKHFVHGGFGIRQVCDMILFMKKYHSYIDYQRFDSKIKKYHFDIFWFNLLDIAEKYLGFSYEEVGYKKIETTLDSEDLLNDLLDSGVFGRSSLERTHSSTMTLNALKNHKSSMLSNIFHSLFPDYKYMLRQYEYLKKYPFLLVIAYIQRMISYLNRKNKSHEKHSSIHMGKQRIEILKKYNLIK